MSFWCVQQERKDLRGTARGCDPAFLKDDESVHQARQVFDGMGYDDHGLTGAVEFPEFPEDLPFPGPSSGTVGSSKMVGPAVLNRTRPGLHGESRPRSAQKEIGRNAS